ncbi:MAG: hypothetical protein F6K23_16765 [Okeania sp. SIO2C9]|uniref:hormogonium polysaccharide biosynthesis protein HpsA n=1 Tax=Okeania sp. SIO2C9 TaxID=2607791 RepID=UPI0013C27B25|nr:hormogonium polysaccharide biosynthesis protein HpsA [Okeania sp. SIO2C9]NEQ74542.1 hypothetical protein [Okeania sp. SIO2C9]
MLSNKLFRAVIRLFKRISQYSKTITRELIRLILLRKSKARSHPTQSQLSGVGGFVLPTVTMVLLVVVLLSIAILLRSFDRAEVARTNVVNRTTLEAALPAIDRARAKIDALFADSTLPRTTPEDLDLYNALKQTRYNFADETRLKLAYDFDGTAGFTAEESSDAIIDDNEDVRTAWRFPVDTDNDGQYDTFTLYAILFRNPPTQGVQQSRIRNPLEARSLPQTLDGGINPACAAAPEASGDWYKYTGEGVIKKSFFVYTVNVPLTAQQATALGLNYEVGRSGFSALELQQDRNRIPLNNNAVWFEGDIELSNVSNFNLNGRVFTNSNLLVAGPGFTTGNIKFYQVSDPQSCYYLEENSKIIVAGNVANNDIVNDTDGGKVEVHRFLEDAAPAGQGNANDGINGTNKSTNSTGGRDVGNNVDAYNRRIGTLVDEAETFLSGSVVNAPQQVADNYTSRISDPSETASPEDILKEEIELYFKERIRKVPYAEVAFGADPLGTPPVLDTSSFTPNDDSWMEVYEDNFTLQQLAATDPEQLDGEENFIGDRVVVGNGLPERWFDGSNFQTQDDEQTIVPNVNWLNPDGSDSGTIRTRQSQVTNLPDLGSTNRDGFWEKEAAKQPSTGSATGGVRIITGAGIYIDGEPLASGTGQREDDNGTVTADEKSFLPAPPTVANLTAQGLTIPAAIGTATEQVVWPDSMPMWEDTNEDGVPNFDTADPANTDLKGDLQMRATVVYHYLNSDAEPGELQVDQEPSHCVSSYYDPSTPLTARNQTGLPDVSGGIDTDGDGIINILADGTTPTPVIGSNDGLSNNGVVYPFPGRTIDRDILDRQASMVFPNGRLVNQPLRTALEHIDGGEDLTFADYGAIDSAVCSLAILDGTIGPPNENSGGFSITHGTIKETTFLDGREVKSLNRLEDDPDTATVDESQIYAADTIADLRGTYTPSGNDKVNTGTYTLPLEHRQPQELRVTDLDLELMRTLTVGTGTGAGPDNDQEYLLPNSGIIYATRDDALPDLSDAMDPNNPTSTNESTSPTDFILDPSAKPNGIRLINGSYLDRGSGNDYRYVEKGLILVTNLPAYLRADGNGGFNLHTGGEEFNAALNTDPGIFWNNFYTRGASGLNNNFACRNSEPGCGGGDRWRTATVIADAMTVISNDFKDGFRNQGDFDLRNNAGNIIWEPGQPTERKLVELRLNNGFWYNNFVTSADWGTQFPAVADRNSYLTNGVTPIQRRANNFPEYLMEVCTKLPVSECGDGDWDVMIDGNADGIFRDSDDARDKASSISSTVNLLSGTTAQAAAPGLERYARRVAFWRNGSNELLQDDDTTPVTTANELVPLVISGGTTIQKLPYSSGNVPAGVNGALWFHTTNNNTNPTTDVRYTNNQRLFIKEMPIDPATGNVNPLGQPMLSPMLQIHLPRNNPGNNPFNGNAGYIYDEWLQNVTANTTTYNVGFVSGITPSRPNPAESGAGLHNFVRLIEQWRDGGGKTISIAGNFIQSGDSKYATAPFQAADPNQDIGFLYNTNDYLNGTSQAGTWVYRTNNAAGRAPFYRFANRAWGFDVGILSQSPDLFAQRFTSPPVSDPDEFFREVSRDDLWIQTLLCAAQAGDTNNTGGGPNETYTNFALDQSQRQGTWCENDTTANYPANPNI